MRFLSFNAILATAFLPIFIGAGNSVKAQDLQKTITYRSTALPVKRLLQDLSSKAGVVLRSSSQTEDEVLLLDVRDVTLLDLMNRIADVAGSEWSQDADGYRLVRSAALAQKQLDIVNAERAKRLEKAIAQLVAEADKVPVYDQNAARAYLQQARTAMQSAMSQASGGQFNVSRTARQFTNLSAGTPGGRAIARLLTLFSPQALAALPPGSRTVYSTKPTPMQRPLPTGSTPILSKFIEEQRTANQVVQEAGNQEPFSMLVLGQGSGKGDPVKTLLIVTRFGNTDGLMLQLTSGDANGDSIATGFTSLMPQLEQVEATYTLNSTETGALSELSKQFGQLCKNGSGATVVLGTAIVGGGDNSFTIEMSPQPKLPEVTATWRDRILNPEKYEPLETVPQDVLRALQSASGKNLVASIPDDCLIPIAQAFSEGSFQVKEAVRKLQVDWEMSIREEGAWLLIKPRNPIAARDERIERSGLGSMLRTLASTHRLTLDQLAGYVLSQPRHAPGTGFENLYARLINQPYADAELGPNLSRREMLRFYALAGASQRQMLAAGRPLPTTSFTNEQTALLRDMVFHSPAGPNIRVPRAQGAQTNVRMTMQVMARGAMAMGTGGNLREERTEALPNGIPTGSFLTLRRDQQQAVLASQSSGGPGQIMTAGQLGLQNALAGRTELPAFATRTSYDRYLMGSQVTYNFTFQLGQNATLSRSLNDTVFDLQRSSVPFEQLPRNFRNQVSRAASETAERFERGGRRRNPTQQNPPPPHP